MLEPRFLSVGAIAVGDIHANDRGHDLVEFRWFHQDANIARERFVPGRSAQRDAEKDLVADAHRLAADVIRVLNRADETAAVIGDIELPREIVE